MTNQEKNRKERINAKQISQFGLFQNMPMSSELQLSSLEQLAINYQSDLVTLQNLLEDERKKLVQILLEKDKIISTLAQRKTKQAYLDNCIINPLRHLYLKPGYLEKYQQLLPQYAKTITILTNELDKISKEQQGREINIINLEAEIAKLKHKLKINNHLMVLINNPNSLFDHSLNNRQSRKPRSYIDIDAKIETSRKPQL